MRDGVRLLADVYRPAGHGRWPVILERTPYDRTVGASFANQLNAIRLAGAGYAVVIQDVRGRFGSEGDFYPFTAEGQDGLDTIEWAAEQLWSTGDVGMAGSSYRGYAQVLAARECPPALKAWFPAFTPLDVRDGWVYEADAFALGFNLSWTLGLIAPTDRRTQNPERLLSTLDDWPAAIRRPITDQPELAGTPAATYYFDWIRRRDDHTYWSAVSGRGVGRCRAPAMVIGGWFDVFAQGLQMLNLQLNGEAGGNQRNYLIVGPWDHSPLPLQSFAGESEFGASAVLDLAATQQQFFDWLLRGESPPDWPRVRTFITGLNRWQSWNRWPPASRNHTWYLQPGGGLDESGAADGEDVFTIDAEDPTPTLGGRLCCWQGHLRSGRFDQRPRESRPDVRSYTSMPLTEDLLVAGGAEADILSSSSAPVGDIFATLVDVAPDGPALNLAEGVRRQSCRQGTTEVFEVSLGAVGHLFRKGHRIRLDISGMSFPRFDRVPASGRARRTVAMGKPGVGSYLTMAVPA